MAKTQRATLGDNRLGQDLKTAQDAATLQTQATLKSNACRDKTDEKSGEHSLFWQLTVLAIARMRPAMQACLKPSFQ